LVGVFQDEGSFQLKQSAREFLRSLGSEEISKLGWRDTWAFVAKKAGLCNQNTFFVIVSKVPSKLEINVHGMGSSLCVPVSIHV
jgi:hypothetical protein